MFSDGPFSDLAFSDASPTGPVGTALADSTAIGVGLGYVSALREETAIVYFAEVALWALTDRS